MTRRYLVETMVEADSETVFFTFSLDLSEKVDHLTAPSNVLQQKHFRAQCTYYAQSVNGRANSLNSYTFFFKTQTKFEVTNIRPSLRLPELDAF